jgi:hypothetical protein
VSTAGIVAASSISAHNLGAVTFTAGAITGATTLNTVTFGSTGNVSSMGTLGCGAITASNNISAPTFTGALIGNVTGNISNISKVSIYVGTAEYANFTTSGLLVTGINNCNGGISNTGSISGTGTCAIDGAICNAAPSTGYCTLKQGTSSNTGFVEFFRGDTVTRQAYIGYGTSGQFDFNVVAPLNIFGANVGISPGARYAPSYPLDVNGTIRATTLIVGGGTSAVSNVTASTTPGTPATVLMKINGMMILGGPGNGTNTQTIAFTSNFTNIPSVVCTCTSATNTSIYVTNTTLSNFSVQINGNGYTGSYYNWIAIGLYI